MKNVIDIFNDYQGNSVILVLAFMAMIYMLVKAGKKSAEYIVGTGAVLVILAYNDLIFYLVGWIWGADMYYSYVYAIPSVLICAVAAVLLVFKGADTWWRRLVLTVGAIIIGMSLYRMEISPDISAIAAKSEDKVYDRMNQDILADAEVRRVYICNDAYTEDERISIAADRETYGYLRGLNGSYVMAYDLEKHLHNTEETVDMLYAEPLIYDMASNGAQNEFNLMRELLSIDCVEYVVVQTEQEMDDYMGLVGYLSVGEYGKYTLYARNDECYPMRVGYWGYVRRVYFYLLGRRGTYEEIYTEIQKIGSQERTLDEVAYRILETEEFKNRNLTVDETIEAVYHAIFNRDATDIEHRYWKNYLGNRGNCSDMYRELYYNSGEFKIEWE